ncbi:MAG: proline dehydrogenase family protein [Acidimicrobiales bacterium]
MPEVNVQAAADLAAELLTESRRLEARGQRARRARLARLSADPASLDFALALTDQVARITEPRRALRRLEDLVVDHGIPAFLGRRDAIALRGALRAGRAAPRCVDTLVRARIRRETRAVVLPAEDRRFSAYVGRRRRAGVDLNVNLLGEAILGQEEAGRRLAAVLAHVQRPDVDYVSVKASAVVARISSLGFEHSLGRVTNALRPLFATAAGQCPPVFINLDMEEYRDLEITLSAFRALLDEPDLAGLDAGIALQAYLPEAHAALEELAPWAVARRRNGGGRTKVRLVKGANLAMEVVEAELHGWTPAPYPSKAEVDASYKRLLERALDPEWGDALRVGVASHNLFDLAWGLLLGQELGTADRVELEMLEGMAPGEVEALRRRGHHVRLYAPFVRRQEFDSAVAYVARRLEENSAGENWLRHHLTMQRGTAELEVEEERFRRSVAQRHTVPTTVRRDQDRSRQAAIGRAGRETSSDAGSDRIGTDSGPDAAFTNVPDTDWARRCNRTWVAAALAKKPAPWPAEVPGGVGDRDSTPGPLSASADPSHPERALYRYTTADRTLVDRAVDIARGAQATWAKSSVRHRARVLTDVAHVLEHRRGELISAMVTDAGKVVADADVEVSEAVDYANYYARQGLELGGHTAVHSPLGTVVVAPSWNFPLAIPLGGILAGLATGNSVILKPAPEAVMTAWLATACLADAGVPPDALQFLACDDGEVSRHLVTHPGVDAVLLTGAWSTAQMFLDWRPELHLLAETSGQNAMIVTAAADIDLAVADLVRSAFGHAGQKCSAASLAIVERGALTNGRFLAKLADATRTLVIGPAEDPATEVGPLIRPPDGDLRRGLTRLDPGESWLVEPHQVGSNPGLWSPGVRTGVRPGSWFHLTECFGPVLGVIEAEDLDDALEIQNATAYGLAGGLHSLDPREVDRWLARVEVGNAYVNRAITGAVVGRQPFGGWKHSAVGPTAKTGGPGYLRALCRWRDHVGDDGQGDRLALAVESFPAAWVRLAAPIDGAGLASEENVLRHLPLPGVVLRVGTGVDPVDVELCLLAARITTTPVVVIPADDEPAERAAKSLTASGRSISTLRVLGRPEETLLREAHSAGVTVDCRAPVADAEVELRRWSREQAVSLTSHRYGHILARRFTA